MKSYLLSLFLFCVLSIPSQLLAEAYYLKIDGIEGESRASGHEGEIDILSWSWGAASNKRGSCLQDISFVKSVDKSTTQLLLGQANVRSFPEVVFYARKDSGDAHLDYLKITMTNVIVSSYQSSGSAGGDVPTENFSLNFERIKYSYTPFLDDGRPGPEEVVEFASTRCG